MHLIEKAKLRLTKSKKCSICRQGMAWRTCNICERKTCGVCSSATVWVNGVAQSFSCNVCDHSTRPNVGHRVIKVKKRKPTEAENLRARLIKEKKTFDLPISNEAFLSTIPYLLKTRNEIAGFGYFDGEQIVWMWMSDDAEGSSAHVDSDDGEATLVCMNELDEIPNVQWHTHPGFSSSPSPTDITSHMTIIKDKSGMGIAGFQIFLILSDLCWSLCRYDWNDKGEITDYYEGAVSLNGTPLVKPTRTTATTYAGGGFVYYENYATPHDNGTYKYPTASDYEYNPIAGRWEKKAAPVEKKPATATNSYSQWTGLWSNEDGDYDLLFKIFDVEKYKWHDLYDTISPNNEYKKYIDIVDNPHLWGQLFYGTWSNRNEDYDALFDACAIGKYDWELLHDTIANQFQVAGYDLIIEHQDMWESVALHFEEIRKEANNGSDNPGQEIDDVQTAGLS